MESGGNFEDYIRFLSCHLFGPVNHGQNWKGWERSGEKGLIISDNQDETCLIITINDTSIGDLPLIITISDTCKNHPKRFDFDNTITFSHSHKFPFKSKSNGIVLTQESIDKFMKVTDEESAHATREIAKKEGLFVGYTSGAAFQAVKQYAALGEFNKNSNVIIVFPDHGSRYMSKIYSDEWMQEQGFLDAENSDDSMKIEVIK